MRPARWQQFLWLQTERAYPHGPHEVAPCHVKSACEFGWVLPQQIEHLLIVGPGTANEVNALRNWLRPKDFRVVTALESERDWLISSGVTFEQNILLGDLQDLQVTTGWFDFVFNANVLEHMIAPFAALLELRRVLRPGGRVYSIIPTFETPSGGYGPFHLSCLSDELWQELHRKAGLRITDRAVKAEVPFAEREHYYHYYAEAVEPPEPYNELLARISKD